jgi:hypothetical protein
VDEIVPEPLGGAHTDPDKTAEILRQHLLKNLERLLRMPASERLKKRYEKYRACGHFLETPLSPAEKASTTRKSSKRPSAAVSVPAV